MIELVQHLASEGYDVKDVVPDGKLRRFKVDSKDQRNSGFYIAYQNFSSENGQPFYVMVYGSWRGEETKVHCTLQGKIEKADRERIQQRLDEMRRREEAERRALQEVAAKEAQGIWENLGEFGGSEYLKRKGIDGVQLGIRFDNTRGEIYVPARDSDGRLWSYQRIKPDGSKRFHFGGRFRGCYHIVGDILQAETVRITEGLATAGSIHLATSEPVVVAFNASNLCDVAAKIRELHPDKQIIICGDDDRFTTNAKGDPWNPGREKAEEAARKCLGSCVFPKFESDDGKPTDFNDLHQREGLHRAKEQLLGAEKKEKLALYALGFKESEYFFTSTSNRQVVGLISFSEDNLLKLMPLEYWEAVFPKEKGGVDWMRAKSELMDRCRTKGIFNGKDVRGSGVWRDHERIVVNMGDHLIVDGKRCELGSLKSRYFYTLSPRLEPLHEKPLTAEECAPLIEACKTIKWTRKDDGFLLAGALVTSRICGALPVRPHVWITGGAETGKSTILEKLVKPILGDSKLYFEGSTTEAAVRQDLKASAVPVLFDEFETTDLKSAERIAGLIELMRSSWSDGGGVIAKGGASGNAMHFQVKFSAIVSSIRTKLTNDADKGRFAVLELAPHGSDPDHWRHLSDLLARIDAEFSERLFSRVIKLLPTLLANYKSIKAKLSQKAGSRFGDQYGMILAGYSVLLTDEAVDDSTAEFLAGISTLEDQQEQAKVKDQDDALEHMKTTKYSFEGKSSLRRESLIEDMILRTYYDQTAMVKQDDGELLALQRLGVAVKGEFVYVVQANHSELERAVWRNTPKWSKTWGEALGRLPGAKKRTPWRVGGPVKMCVKIPIEHFLGKN